MNDERRYSEAELHAIFERAAKRQEEARHAEAASRGQLTLAELQEIGEASGIDPAHVAAAARELASPVPAEKRVLGFPAEVRRTRLITGPVTDEQINVNGEWLTFRVRGGATTPDALFAPTTKTPYTDEFMLGYEHALTSDMSVGITFTDRKTRDILEDYDLGIYTDPAQAGELALPLSYFGFDSLPAANYFIATLAGGKRDYQGAELTFRKRRTPEDAWQLLASYSYNDAEGNTNSDSNADLQGDFVYLDPRAPNVYGPQPGNVEHIFKLAGSYAWENGLEVGAVYFWNSGTLYSETFAQYGRHTPVRVGTPYEWGGYTTSWLAPGTVGSQSTPSYGTLDLRAKYTMDIRDRYQAEFFLDIFNVLDDQSTTRQQDLSGGDGVYNFGEPNAWVTPRRFYLGARFSF